MAAGPSRFKLAWDQITRGVSAVWTRIGGQGLGSRLRYLLPGARLDYEREAGDLWMSSLVAIALKWVGDNYPKPRLQVSRVARDGSYVPLPRHRVCDLMRRPNPYYTGRVLAKAIALSLLTDGNAYVVKIRDGLGRPAQLWWVPHWLIQPIWETDTGAAYIKGYQFLRDYQVVTLAPQDVIHFRDGLDPRNDRLGLAAIKGQLREICTDNEVSGYTASILRNLGVPGLVAIPKDGAKLTPDQGNKLKERIRDTLTGDMRGDTLVLLSGSVELVKIGFSPEEMRLDKLPARGEARILAALGVSPMVVGLPDPNKTYSNLKEANSAGWRHCIVPLQDLVADTLDLHLLPEFDDPEKYRVGFDYSDVEALQEDLSEKHERVREDFKANLIEQNEARDLLGYEPHPDGDRFFFELAGGGSDPSAPDDPDDSSPGTPTKPDDEDSNVAEEDGEQSRDAA
ncbi:MAG TPA: phage portal protein [Gemmatimonadales bacterium]|nr:phage portal protein [Gemmatimonadales bacterium]